ncbi:MAG: SDR family oxidoreductase [Candidatus Eremiobacteraeota bacterium]|nr:SDR family oxidoreductase [Candidatus Eremiobacteraeota bacterium]
MPALLVTGGSRGIGAAIARRAAVAGWDVALTYERDSDAAHTVAAEVKRAGRRALAQRADVAEERDVVHAFDAAESALGPITGLVNNAGITGGLRRVESVDPDMLTRLFAVNVIGTMLCAREAVRRMSTAHGGTGGAIVNVSSRAAQLGGAGEWVHYAATKGAVETFTRGLAREVVREAIRVNAVAPGLIETELHAAAGAPDRTVRLAPGIPAGRSGTADEVAEAVVWLLSPAASYVVGAILPVSGGR